MNKEQLISIGVLIAVASAAFFCVWLASKRLKSVASGYMLAGVLWVLALLGMWFIDTNVPLYTSHYRPGGEAAPSWLAILAFFVRSAAFAAIVVAVSRHRKSKPLNAIAPKDGAPH